MQDPNTFGRKLAHTDKTVRDDAVDMLVKWLKTKESLTEFEMLKLWKGLFYSFWMSDKPLVQREFADSLASVISQLEIDHQFLYIETFWKTILKEWHGIDRFRLNKYYMLMRRFQSTCFTMMQTANWNSDLVSRYAQMLTDGPLAKDQLPDSIKYHIIEAFLQELEPILNSEPPMAILLKPFVTLVSQTKNPVVIQKTKEEIFDKLLLKCQESAEWVDAHEITSLFNEFIQLDLEQVNKKAVNGYYALFSQESATKTPKRKISEETTESEKKRVKWGKKLIKSSIKLTVAFEKRLPTKSISSPKTNVSAPIKSNLKAS